MKLSDHIRNQCVEQPDYSVIRDSADELDRLTAALPKTADGVTIVPGMDVWWMESGGVVERCVVISTTKRNGGGAELQDYWGMSEDCWWTSARNIYSTRTAAEEAAAAK